MSHCHRNCGNLCWFGLTTTTKGSNLSETCPYLSQIHDMSCTGKMDAMITWVRKNTCMFQVRCERVHVRVPGNKIDISAYRWWTAWVARNACRQPVLQVCCSMRLYDAEDLGDGYLQQVQDTCGGILGGTRTSTSSSNSAKKIKSVDNVNLIYVYIHKWMEWNGMEWLFWQYFKPNLWIYIYIYILTHIIYGGVRFQIFGNLIVDMAVVSFRALHCSISDNQTVYRTGQK